MITSFEMEWICVGKGKWSRWKTMDLWTIYTSTNIDIHNHGKKSLFVCANIDIFELFKKRNSNLSNFSRSSFTCDMSKSINLHVKHDCGNKFVHVNSTLTTFIKLQTLSLVIIKHRPLSNLKEIPLSTGHGIESSKYC
jgi:hypothetical protein